MENRLRVPAQVGADHQIGLASRKSSIDGHDQILAIDGLTVEFPARSGAMLACSDMSFSVGRGEIVGLVGESGSGKSVAALSVLRLTPPPGRLIGGHVRFEGRDLSSLTRREMLRLRGKRIGFVSQTPRASLNPALRIRDQITAMLRACDPGFRRADASSRIRALLAPLGFPDPDRVAESFPHQLSGGMCQRVAIALALAGEPSLLIADEPTTALDVAVQADILLLLRRLNRERGLSILLVTHDLSVVRALAHRVVVVYGGQVQETGPTDAVLTQPAHPYTRALLAAFPDPEQPPRRLIQLPGQVEAWSPTHPGCRLANRCVEAIERCATERPRAHAVAHGGRARCHLVAKHSDVQ